jgi:hypothetical protein
MRTRKWTRLQLQSRLASTDRQNAFANEVVAAMKNRLTEGRAMACMRQVELS